MVSGLSSDKIVKNAPIFIFFWEKCTEFRALLPTRFPPENFPAPALDFPPARRYHIGIGSAATDGAERNDSHMTLAVTYENGMVFQHFGHTEQFKIYRIAHGKITDSQVVSTNGCATAHWPAAGHAGRGYPDLRRHRRGAQQALAQAGIRLYGGVTGSADEAAAALLSGTLAFDPAARCDHHGEGHHCGQDHQGCAGHSGCHTN